MKKIICSLAALCFAVYTFALDASVTFATFQSPKQAYVEISLFVVGTTVEYQAVDSTQMQAAVEVIILFKQGEQILKFDKFNLNSPIAKNPLDFVDLRRYALAAGDYQLEVSIQDVNSEKNVKKYSAPLPVKFETTTLQQSDIQLLKTVKKSTEENMFVKNGYYLEPLSFNFYDKYAEQLTFYNEIYNADKALGEDYLVSYSISKEVDPTKPVLIAHKRRKADPINVLLFQMDISSLASGNYNLDVEIRDREKTLLSSKQVTFQRSNPYFKEQLELIKEEDIEEEFVQKLSDEDVEYSIRAIAPLVDDLDGEHVNLIIKNQDYSAMRLYLFSYWARENANRPEVAYLAYMEVARAVDEMFTSGFGYGFETDRGYVFLKYGRPDDRFSEMNDPSAPPYEIWSYNDFPRTNQSNIKFIFYNPTLSPGNYQMLHSNAIGEIYNPRWEVELYSNDPNNASGTNYIDGTGTNGGYGRNARSRWSDF